MAAGDGLVTMTPTSITHAGTSASINADGGVDFTAVTSLSLNGVFTSSFDNYVIFTSLKSSAGTGVSLRFRVGGTDNSTASSYVSQYLGATGTTVNGGRQTGDNAYLLTADSANNAGYQEHIYGPYLAQSTAVRGVSGYGNNGARIEDWAFTHNQSTSYDGFTIYTAGATLTGNIVVFGYEE